MASGQQGPLAECPCPRSLRLLGEWAALAFGRDSWTRENRAELRVDPGSDALGVLVTRTRVLLSSWRQQSRPHGFPEAAVRSHRTPRLRAAGFTLPVCRPEGPVQARAGSASPCRLQGGSFRPFQLPGALAFSARGRLSHLCLLLHTDSPPSLCVPNLSLFFSDKAACL